jgi:membrane protease YdiL (CAAX protease family)
LMRRHPLFFFFFISYAGSWIVMMPYVLSVWGILPGDYSILYIIKPFVGPMLAAIIMTGITEGKSGLLHLRDRLKQRSAGRQWYIFILLGIPILTLIGIIVQPGLLASFKGVTPVLLVTYPAYFFIVFFGVALPEEIGWRGFALPRMQPRYGPL